MPRWALRVSIIKAMDGDELAFTPDGTFPLGVHTVRSDCYGVWKVYSTDSD